MAIDESAVQTIPKGLTTAQAAALPLVALTSYNALVTVGQMRPGNTVLILGGSSATGMMAVQLAKAYAAADVVATCSPRNEALVKSLGANQTLDYRTIDVFEAVKSAGKQFDIIYGTASRKPLTLCNLILCTRYSGHWPIGLGWCCWGSTCTWRSIGYHHWGCAENA